MKASLAISFAMAAALLASSIGVVYVQHSRRAQFVELQRLEAERDALQVEWGQLQLERSTWAAHDRIERLARERLDLAVPTADSIVLVVP